MALTSQQRKKLPPSAFVYPKQKKYPVPTPAQAKAAGISPKENAAIHRNALSRAAQSGTSGSYSTVAAKVKQRGIVTPGKTKGKR